MRNIKRYEILSFYNGYRFFGTDERKIFIDKCKRDIKMLEAFDIGCNGYQFQSSAEEYFNISPKSIDLSLYNATLAHVASHTHGNQNNANFGFLDHPRFGPIMCLFANEPIKANEKILIDYRYTLH